MCSWSFREWLSLVGIRLGRPSWAAVGDPFPQASGVTQTGGARLCRVLRRIPAPGGGKQSPPCGAGRPGLAPRASPSALLLLLGSAVTAAAAPPSSGPLSPVAAALRLLHLPPPLRVSGAGDLRRSLSPAFRRLLAMARSPAAQHGGPQPAAHAAAIFPGASSSLRPGLVATSSAESLIGRELRGARTRQGTITASEAALNGAGASSQYRPRPLSPCYGLLPLPPHYTNPLTTHPSHCPPPHYRPAPHYRPLPLPPHYTAPLSTYPIPHYRSLPLPPHYIPLL